MNQDTDSLPARQRDLESIVAGALEEARRAGAAQAEAGVSIDEAERTTAKIKRLARQTFNRQVLTGIGSFGAAFALETRGLKRPVVVG